MRSREFAQSTGQQVLVADAAAFMQRVYGWMTAGLAVTGLVAYQIATSRAAIELIFGNSMSLFLIVICR